MAAYYNEIEPFAAAWLRELIKRDLIAPGDVDERSIELVQPADLRRYTQCHFFAGIGVWSYALFNAGWADTDPVWTGSCPCQPFSPAGKGEGFNDPRHLWPHFYRLIRECRPDVVFGEQTASPAGLVWLDLVCSDLEGSGYAVGATNFPAASVGAPHIRQRLYWVGHSERTRLEGYGRLGKESLSQRRQGAEGYGAEAGSAGWLADADGGNARAEGLQRRGEHGQRSEDGGVGILGNADGGRLERADIPVRPARQDAAATVERGADFWSAADWIPCADGKARPVEPGTFPLVTGAPARLVRLRGYGNGLNAEQAKAFIEAYLDVRGAA